MYILTQLLMGKGLIKHSALMPDHLAQSALVKRDDISGKTYSHSFNELLDVFIHCGKCLGCQLILHLCAVFKHV